MSFIGDFFKSLANNPNVIDDDTISAELNQFLSENSESNNRISFLEHDVSLDREALKNVAKKAIQKVKTNKSIASSEKNNSLKDSKQQEIEK